MICHNSLVIVSKIFCQKQNTHNKKKIVFSSETRDYETEYYSKTYTAGYCYLFFIADITLLCVHSLQYEQESDDCAGNILLIEIDSKRTIDSG